jgi:hypothetical protein
MTPSRDNALVAVIPAKAGIHCCLSHARKWIPAFAGMTDAKGY